jgi:hypothetical protein
MFQVHLSRDEPKSSVITVPTQTQKMHTYNGRRGSPLGVSSSLRGLCGGIFLFGGDFGRLTLIPRPVDPAYAFSSNVVSIGALIPG